MRATAVWGLIGLAFAGGLHVRPARVPAVSIGCACRLITLRLDRHDAASHRDAPSRARGARAPVSATLPHSLAVAAPHPAATSCRKRAVVMRADADAISQPGADIVLDTKQVKMKGKSAATKPAVPALRAHRRSARQAVPHMESSLPVPPPSSAPSPCDAFVDALANSADAATKEVAKLGIRLWQELQAKDSELQAKDSELQAKNSELQLLRQAKDSELLQQAKDAELLRQAKDAELLRQAKDAELQAKDAELQAKDAELLRQAKDAELLRQAKDAELLLQAKDAELKQKNADYNSAVENLSRYRAVLEPRILIEWALKAKYAPLIAERETNKKLRPLSTTELLYKFHKENVLDKAGKLRPQVKELMSVLGCKERDRVISDDIKTMYSRLSVAVHNGPVLPNVREPGFCCGGDANSGGCANAILIKLLQDDPDVHAAGVIRFDIPVLDEKLTHKNTFAPYIITTADDDEMTIIYDKRANRTTGTVTVN
jgi:hypothetical protein